MDNILHSWSNNATQWTQLIREEGLASRVYTNPAILAQIDHGRPLRICDLGCGEGWLTRALQAKGHRVTGIDGTLALIEQAKQGGRDFYHLTYEDVIAGAELPNAPFDRIILNFCLYQASATEALLAVLSPFLRPGGKIIIQTIHPFYLLQRKLPYQNQWIPNAWAGLPADFTDPHPWYCRTLSGWQETFQRSQWQCQQIVEVCPPDHAAPLSIIFHLTPSHVH